MWNVVVQTAGWVVIVGTLLDVVATVIAVTGGHGPISSLASRLTWRTFRRAFDRIESHAFLGAAGPAVFLAVTLTWGALLVIGWSLVFSADGALTSTDGQVGILDLFDHSASLVFGGSSPLVSSAAQPWSVIARIARFTGLGLASFGLAFALPVVRSVVTVRTLARTIHTVRGPDGGFGDVTELDEGEGDVHLFFVDFVKDFSNTCETLRAYPIVPYFHAPTPAGSLAVNLRALNSFLDADDDVVSDGVRHALRRSIDACLDVIDEYFIEGRFAPDVAETSDADERRCALIGAWCRQEGWGDGSE